MTTTYTRRATGAQSDPLPPVAYPVRYHSAAEIIAAIEAAAAVAPESGDDIDDGPQRAAFAEFHYTIAGVRGRYTIGNTRARLLEYAQRVKRASAAFDGKAKRAPKPAKVPAASPVTTARELLAARQYVEGLDLLDRAGGVFFGAGGKLPNVYTKPAFHTVGGMDWVIARCAVRGSLRILHAESGLAADSEPGRGIRQTFKREADALAFLERITADDEANEYRGKIRAAAARAVPYSQAAARAALEAADGAETEARAAALAAAAYEAARAIEAAAAPAADKSAEVEPAAPLEAPAVAAMELVAEAIAPAPVEAIAAPVEAIGADPAAAMWAAAERHGAALDAMAEALAGCLESAPFAKPDGRFALAGPDVSTGRFRVTRFDDAGPIGHTEYRSAAEAMRSALAEGYTYTPERDCAPELAAAADELRGAAAEMERAWNRKAARPVADGSAEALHHRCATEAPRCATGPPVAVFQA